MVAVYLALCLAYVSLRFGVTFVSKRSGPRYRRKAQSSRPRTRPETRQKAGSRASRAGTARSDQRATARLPATERLVPEAVVQTVSSASRLAESISGANGAPSEPNTASSRVILISPGMDRDESGESDENGENGENGESDESGESDENDEDASAVVVRERIGVNSELSPSTKPILKPGAVAESSPHQSESGDRRNIAGQLYTRRTKSRRARLFSLGVTIAVVATLIAGVRITSAYMGADSTLTVRIDNQQPVTIDPRASAPRSPYVYGVNVFPEEATQALDGAYGFMPYDARTISGLKGASVTLLRFPGGAWGEEHTASFAQVSAFLTLARETHAAPLMQVRLQGGSPGQAAALVSYCNHANDPNRASTPNAPFLPVRFWVIGNEPDLIGPSYTVSDYARDFIVYATAMKAVDPTIQIYGPELSDINGLDTPVDSTGTPWLTGFLKGIAAYEQAHHTRILDGVSFHSYTFGNTTGDLGLTLSSANAWRYTLPAIRMAIQEIMGARLPIAVTEINTSIHASDDLLTAALWWADNLGALQEAQVNIVGFFAARGLPLKDMLLTLAGNPTPLYYVMRLYSHMAKDVIQVGGTPGPVSVYAATSPSHDVITLMFVNKSPNAAMVSIAPGQAFSGWRDMRLDVPPYTTVCAVVYPGGSGQTYTYGPSATMLAHGDMGRIVSQPLTAQTLP
ncbi:MAG TPA: glycoside hydrolase family 44 protein [Ktedonobacterales bacterium]